MVNMLRRQKPWRLGLTEEETLNWTVWWKQTRQHEGFPGPVASFKGGLGLPGLCSEAGQTLVVWMLWSW